MPKINNNSKNNAITEYYECCFVDITDAYPEIQKYLQHNFGLNRGKIKVCEDPSGESVYLIFREESFWLFEVDEFTSYFYGEELLQHISDRLSSTYDRIATKYL